MNIFKINSKLETRHSKCQTSNVARRTSNVKLQNGFTLIEVLIAIAFLGIIAIALFSGLSTAYKAYWVSNKQATAMALAQSQLEEIEKLSYSESGNYSAISAPANYSINITTNSININQLQKIIIEIKYGTQTVYSVSDYKVN